MYRKCFRSWLYQCQYYPSCGNGTIVLPDAQGNIAGRHWWTLTTLTWLKEDKTKARTLRATTRRFLTVYPIHSLYIIANGKGHGLIIRLSDLVLCSCSAVTHMRKWPMVLSAYEFFLKSIPDSLQLNTFIPVCFSGSHRTKAQKDLNMSSPSPITGPC